MARWDQTSRKDRMASSQASTVSLFSSNTRPARLKTRSLTLLRCPHGASGRGGRGGIPTAGQRKSPNHEDDLCQAPRSVRTLATDINHHVERAPGTTHEAQQRRELTPPRALEVIRRLARIDHEAPHPIHGRPGPLGLIVQEPAADKPRLCRRSTGPATVGTASPPKNRVCIGI